MCSLLPSSPAGATMPINLLTALHWLSTWPYAVTISFFPGSKDPQLAQQLQEEIYQYRFHTFAEGTKASYRTHRTSYLRFCEHIGYPTLPAQSSHFCKYAAFLAGSLKAASIPNYLNIIGILHKEFNLPNPLLDNSPLQSLLTDCLGLSGSKVCPLAQKRPITPRILGHIYLHLNMRSSFDASFRALCLVIIVVYCHLYQAPPFALLRQLKGLCLGWFFFPCHLYQTPPFALLCQLKGLSLGWFFFPCHLYQVTPVCLVTVVKMAYCNLPVRHRLTPRLLPFFALQI